jgi:hypothetical protein
MKKPIRFANLGSDIKGFGQFISKAASKVLG